MAGAYPQTPRASAWGVEAVIDVFFWRSPRFGWDLEAGYGITFGSGNKKSATMTGRIFFAAPYLWWLTAI